MTKQEAIEFYKGIVGSEHSAIDWSEESSEKTEFKNRSTEEVKTDDTVYFIKNATTEDLQQWLVGDEK